MKNKYGVNVHTRYIAEAKLLCGINICENYNKFKKDNLDVNIINQKGLNIPKKP